MFKIIWNGKNQRCANRTHRSNWEGELNCL